MVIGTSTYVIPRSAHLSHAFNIDTFSGSYDVFECQASHKHGLLALLASCGCDL